MAERKEITSLSVITDSETSYDNIGDIDGGYIDKEWLKNHIASHGTDGLLRQIAYMSFQVWEAMREVNQEKDSSIPAKSMSKYPSVPPPLGDQIN